MFKKLLKGLMSLFNLVPNETDVEEKPSINLEQLITTNLVSIFNLNSGTYPRMILAKYIEEYLKGVPGFERIHILSNRSHVGVRFWLGQTRYTVRIKADITFGIQMVNMAEGENRINIGMSWNQGALCNVMENPIKITKTYVTFERSLTATELSNWLNEANS